MDGDDRSPSTFAKGLETAEPADDKETPRDTIFPGADVAGGDSTPLPDLVLPPPRAPDVEPPRDSDPGKTAALRLRHADSAVQAPEVLVERLTHWSMLAIGIPFAVGSGWLGVLAYTGGQRLLTLGCIFGVLLGGSLVYWWRRMRLVANRDGILIRSEFGSERISWSDLDYVEFQEIPANEEFTGATVMVFVTREQVRIESDLTGSTEPGGYLYTLAQSLLAMRDTYASAPGHPGTTRADQSDG